MLWKKESQQSDALYLDIFAVTEGGKEVLVDVLNDLRTKSSISSKNDALSSQKRKEGNVQFGRGNWNDAMEFYNASLLYAENRSTTISLAYANRSACFLKLKKYKECLMDIEFAKEAGYPRDLLPKINVRESECLKAMEENGQSMEFELKLDFEPDRCFPSMANVLKVVCNDGKK